MKSFCSRLYELLSTHPRAAKIDVHNWKKLLSNSHSTQTEFFFNSYRRMRQKLIRESTEGAAGSTACGLHVTLILCILHMCGTKSRVYPTEDLFSKEKIHAWSTGRFEARITQHITETIPTVKHCGSSTIGIRMWSFNALQQNISLGCLHLNNKVIIPALCFPPSKTVN